MVKAFKYRIYPNAEQREYFAKTFGSTRFIYNRMLNDKIEHYRLTEQTLKNTPAQYKAWRSYQCGIAELRLTSRPLQKEAAPQNRAKAALGSNRSLSPLR